MRIVPVEYAENLHLAEDVYDLSGRVLVKKGASVSSRTVAQLKNAGVFMVYVNDRFSQNQLTPPISTDLRLDITRELRNMYDILRLRAEGGREVGESTLRPLNHVLELADHVLYELKNNPRQYLSFTDIKIREIYTVSHSINVAILALLLGIDAGIDHHRYKDLFLGSLFHDIGMNFIDESVFMKNGKLDVQEFLRIKEHPKKGYELFKDFSFASAYMKGIVLQHHERVDGTGYPNQTPGSEIQPLAKIVAVADTYDAMTSDRSYSRAVSPLEAMENLIKDSRTHFEPHLVDLFIKKIVPYPEGCLVRLSSEEPALVVRLNENDPLRPVVAPIDPVSKKMRPAIIDLAFDKELRIERIQYEMP